MSGTSATTSDAEVARNPHQPKGWRRDDINFLARSINSLDRLNCMADLN